MVFCYKFLLNFIKHMDKWAEEHEKGKFWIVNRFIRVYAKDLSIYAQMVYVAMCCYSGKKNKKEYETFIGCRLTAEIININKDTVPKARKELEEYGLIRRLENKKGKATHYRIYTDPYNNTKPYHDTIPKEYKDIKDSNNKDKKGKTREEVRKELEDKGILKKL